MFLIERSANRQVAFKFGNCPMRLMPFAPDNSGSIFIDNSSAKSTTHAKRRFATVFEILTSKQEWNLLLTNLPQQWVIPITIARCEIGWTARNQIPHPLLTTDAHFTDQFTDCGWLRQRPLTLIPYLNKEQVEWSVGSMCLSQLLKQIYKCSLSTDRLLKLKGYLFDFTNYLY